MPKRVLSRAWWFGPEVAFDQHDEKWFEDEEERQLREAHARLDRVKQFIKEKQTLKAQAQVPHDRRS